MSKHFMKRICHIRRQNVSSSVVKYIFLFKEGLKVIFTYATKIFLNIYFFLNKYFSYIIQDFKGIAILYRFKNV